MSQNPLIYRDIQMELQAYLDTIPSLNKCNIYIDPVDDMKEPWITIDDTGTTDLKWKNHIDVEHNMSFKIRAQTYNTNRTKGINRQLGEDSYKRMGDLFNALHDWFCRKDVVNNPYSKRVDGSNISSIPVVIENIKTKQVVRARDFDITFTYHN